MIRIVKHVVIETAEDRDRQVARVEAAIRARFPDATTAVVQGLLDEDRVVEARLPLRQLAAWREQRQRLRAGEPAQEETQHDADQGPERAQEALERLQRGQ